MNKNIRISNNLSLDSFFYIYILVIYFYTYIIVEEIPSMMVERISFVHRSFLEDLFFYYYFSDEMSI